MQYNFKKIKRNSGQAMLISVVFFLFISLAIIAGLVSPSVREFRIASDLIHSRQSYFLSESGIEDAYYRLKKPLAIGSSTSITLNSDTATTNITDSGYNEKTISSLGDVSNRQRKNELKLNAGAGASFAYGIQAGQGGFIMGNSTVNGNVYSNGTIVGDNGAVITGSAFSAETSGLINNVDVGQGGIGDAWAHTVKNSTIAGNLYCQVGQNNNKSCNTTQPDPQPIAFPITDAQINEWKIDAVSGGTIGSYHPAQDASLGPKKIDGDMTIDDNNLDFTINGIIYATGDIILSNNQGSVRCAASFGPNSCILIADGSIHIKNNIAFGGSGQTGSFLLLISTLDCDGSSDHSPTSGKQCGDHNGAIDLHNNSIGSIIYAPYGKLHLHQNVDITGATAYKIELENNTVVNYDQGLANALFSSGPSGGWDVKSWKEVK